MTSLLIAAASLVIAASQGYVVYEAIHTDVPRQVIEGLLHSFRIT